MKQIAFYTLMIAGDVPEGETISSQSEAASSERFTDDLARVIRLAFGDGMTEDDLVHVDFNSYAIVDEDGDEQLDRDIDAREEQIDRDIDALVERFERDVR